MVLLNVGLWITLTRFVGMRHYSGMTPRDTPPGCNR